MKSRYYLSLLAFALCISASVPASFALSIGDPMPTISKNLQNIDGKTIRLEPSETSKGTLVLFFCNSCPFAKSWEERITDIGNRFQKKGFTVIVINSNDPARNSEENFKDMQARAKEAGFEFPYVVDETSDVARSFGALRTPEVFLFDSSGKLAYHGSIDDNVTEPNKVKHRYLENALEAVLAGMKVLVSETKAIGCTIKFRPTK